MIIYYPKRDVEDSIQVRVFGAVKIERIADWMEKLNFSRVSRRDRLRAEGDWLG